MSINSMRYRCCVGWPGKTSGATYYKFEPTSLSKAQDQSRVQATLAMGISDHRRRMTVWIEDSEGNRVTEVYPAPKSEVTA